MRRTAAGALGIVLVLTVAGCSGPGGPRTTARLGGPPTLEPVASAPSCAEAVRTGSAMAVLSAFRAARVKGQGAEGCLTRAALENYCGPRACPPSLFSGPDAPSPGPICLYVCNGKRVGVVQITGWGKKRAFGLEVGVALPINVANFIDNEYLVLGSGVPATGTGVVRLLIVDTSTSA